MNPYFSIIIPLYNKEKHIKSTLHSVFNQTFQDFEIIIVNDGSTDNSDTIISEIKDPRITIITSKNRGVSHARNLGIGRSNSDKIVFLDADDFWEPFHLENLKTIYQQFPNCGMYATAYAKEKYGIKFKSIFKDISEDENWKGILVNYFKSSLANSIASSSSVLIPKPIFKTIGLFNEDYNSGEDTDMWVRIALRHPVAFCNKISVTHNMDSINKITKLKLSKRKHIDLDAYESYCNETPYLKQYLDFNRASMAIQYKLENEKILEDKIKENIDYSNLNWLQKTLLKTPRIVVLNLLRLRNFSQKLKLDFRLFR
jgi:glycosyltransferase involved in cell wall biosynthesis